MKGRPNTHRMAQWPKASIARARPPTARAAGRIARSSSLAGRSERTTEARTSAPIVVGRMRATSTIWEAME